MYDGSQGNAMTEIALALAMGFFSIMVLTMVSMGAGVGETRTATALMLAPAQTDSAEAGAIMPDAQDVIVIYSDGRFLDTDLRPLDPASISGTGRVVLAFVPDVPLAEAMVARAAISATNLVVSTLDERWLEALAELNP